MTESTLYPYVTGKADDANDGSRNITINVPTGPDATVVPSALVAIITAKRSPSPLVLTPPAGWEYIATQVQGDLHMQCQVFVRKMDGTEPSSYTWNVNLTHYAVGSIVRVAHVDDDFVFDLLPSKGGSSTTQTAPSADSPDNGLALAVAALYRGGPTTSTPPSGYTEVTDVGCTDVAGVSHAIAYKEFDNAGATGTAAFTSSTAAEWIAYTITIAREGAGAGISEPFEGTEVASPTMLLTIDHTKVGAADLTNFVTKIDFADLVDSAGADEFWDAVIPGGGNLRVVNAVTGVEVPIDVVHCDITNRTGYAFFKATLSHTADDTFFVEARHAASAYATTDTYGRNNVWSDYTVVVSGGFIGTNRTGGTNPVIMNSANTTRRAYDDVASVSADTACNQGVAYDGSNIYMNGANILKKYSSGFGSTLITDTDPLTTAGLSSPYNHIGAGCVVGSEWILPAAEYPETGGLNQSIVVFNTSDLSFNRKTNISSLGISDCSAICYNSDLGLYALVSYTDSTHIYMLDSSFALVETITMLTAVTNMQGIAYYAGRYLISSDNAGLYLVSPDGGDAYNVRDALGYTEMEGLASKGDGTFYLLDNGGSGQRKVHTVGLNVRADRPDTQVMPGNTSFGDGARKVTGITKPTQWSMGTRAYANALGGANRAVISFSDNSTTDANREGINYHNATSRWGAWNSTDTWIDDTGGAPSTLTVYRLNEVFNATTNRKLFKNGALAGTDTGTSQRPVSASTCAFFIGVEDTSVANVFDGSLTDVYLRAGLLTDDWIAAEMHSWETGDFYSIN